MPGPNNFHQPVFDFNQAQGAAQDPMTAPAHQVVEENVVADTEPTSTAPVLQDVQETANNIASPLPQDTSAMSTDSHTPSITKPVVQHDVQETHNNSASTISININIVSSGDLVPPSDTVGAALPGVLSYSQVVANSVPTLT